MDRAVGCTVSVVLPFTDPCVALIVELPPATPVARPVELIVATPLLEDDHVTWLEMFWVELSLNVPVATNCCVEPEAIAGFAGVTVIEFNVAEGVKATSTQ